MTNPTNQGVQEKHATTIADYVGDMVALESHIEEALDRQLTETQDDPEAHSAVQRFHDLVKQHRDTLKALQEQVGTTAGNPIIEAGSTLLGKAAGVIDLVAPKASPSHFATTTRPSVWPPSAIRCCIRRRWGWGIRRWRIWPSGI